MLFATPEDRYATPLGVATSSVARGERGGARAPHCLVKYAYTHVLDAFEADFW